MQIVYKKDGTPYKFTNFTIEEMAGIFSEDFREPMYQVFLNATEVNEYNFNKEFPKFKITLPASCTKELVLDISTGYWKFKTSSSALRFVQLVKETLYDFMRDRISWSSSEKALCKFLKTTDGKKFSENFNFIQILKLKKSTSGEYSFAFNDFVYAISESVTEVPDHQNSLVRDTFLNPNIINCLINPTDEVLDRKKKLNYRSRLSDLQGHYKQ